MHPAALSSAKPPAVKAVAVEVAREQPASSRDSDQALACSAKLELP